MNDSHSGKELIVEYPDLLDTTENDVINNSNNIASQNNNHKGKMDTEMISRNDNMDKEIQQQQQSPTKATGTLNSPSITPTKAISKQFETRAADGRRRITPMFIPREQDDA